MMLGFVFDDLVRVMASIVYIVKAINLAPRAGASVQWRIHGGSNFSTISKSIVESMFFLGVLDPLYRERVILSLNAFSQANIFHCH